MLVAIKLNPHYGAFAGAVLSTYTEVYTRKYASMYSNKVADTRLLAVIILTWPASPDRVRAGKQKDKNIFKGVFIRIKLFLKFMERSRKVLLSN